MIWKTYSDVGIAQWLDLECQICDQKVLEKRWENFLLQVQLSGLTLISVEFSSPGPTFWAYSYFGSLSTFVLPKQHVKPLLGSPAIFPAIRVPSSVLLHILYIYI